MTDPNFNVYIAPKPIQNFTAEEYHEYVRGMFLKRVLKSGKKPPAVDGLTITISKTGKLGLRMAKKKRAFAYVTESEIKLLMAEKGLKYSEVWQLFRDRKFIIAESRMAAEIIYAKSI